LAERGKKPIHMKTLSNSLIANEAKGFTQTFEIQFIFCYNGFNEEKSMKVHRRMQMTGLACRYSASMHKYENNEDQ
jgi:ribosomal protein L6P/L9E